MPHPVVVDRVIEAYHRVAESSFASEAERRAHELIAMIEAAVGHPIEPPPAPETEPAPPEPPPAA